MSLGSALSRLFASHLSERFVWRMATLQRREVSRRAQMLEFVETSRWRVLLHDCLTSLPVDGMDGMDGMDE